MTGPTAPDADPTTDLRARAERAAADLRSALERIVLDLAGPNPRPGRIIERTGLDKTLASRLVQTARAPDALSTLQRAPSPSGLRMFVRAAETAGVARPAIDAAEAAVRGLESLLALFPAGRAGLDAAVSGWLPEARDQGERAALQSVYKAMSYLLGYQVEASVWSILLQPSADPRFLDAVHVRGKYGLRRMSEGAPLAVSTWCPTPIPTPGSPPMEVRAIDGRAISGPGDFLLEEFCSRDAPRLEVITSGAEQQFVLPAGQPRINEPVTLVLGELIRNSLQSHATPQLAEEWITSQARVPTRAYLCDVFLRDDVYPGVTPVITRSLIKGAGAGPPRRSSIALDQVNLSVESGWLACRAADMSTGDVPRYPELMEAVFARAGWDARRFRLHRLRLNYPPPGIAVTRWFPLPPAP